MVATPPPFHPGADLVRRVAAEHGTPAYLYDEATLLAAVDALKAFGGPFGFRARYAVKANPNRAIIRIFDQAGIGFDASTVHEARRVLAAGVAPERLQITAQHLPDDFVELARSGVQLTACSLSQIDRIGRALPGSDIGIRINPGEGSGHNNRTNVAGRGASFGIWHELLDEARTIAQGHGLRITHAHHHVGSGGDPAKWGAIAAETLRLVRDFPDVTTVNLGGGFPVARIAGDREADLGALAAEVHALLREFAQATGRELALEIEPGTWPTANAGALVARVIDVVSTGAGGHRFVKLDAGMAEILRPSMYGAQHPISFVPAAAGGSLGEAEPLLVVGPCCESGDILTPARGDPETLGERSLPLPSIGDLAVIGGAGAYCASMAARHYNSIPAAPEILMESTGELRLVRRRETFDDLLSAELDA